MKASALEVGDVHYIGRSCMSMQHDSLNFKHLLKFCLRAGNATDTPPFNHPYENPDMECASPAAVCTIPDLQCSNQITPFLFSRLRDDYSNAPMPMQESHDARYLPDS
jgi:hypothetical protein